VSLFDELKRRNVIKVGAVYLIVGWLLLQVSDTLAPALRLPEWIHSAVAFLVILGFPIALIFAWAFELTPEGLKKEKDVDRSQSITHHTSRKLDFVIIGLMALAIVYFAWDKFVTAPALEETQVSAAPDASEESDTSIAVLPFVNMSDDPGNEYFSDGLSEELLNALVRIGGLKVTGRTSSFAFKGQNTDLREIGRLLNVANVLEGSVRKYENRVRITAQLIKTDDGYHLWSDTFDRELNDIFAIQAEIAEKVTSALKVALLGSPEDQNKFVAVPQRNAEAYEEYLRGMYAFQRGIDDVEGLTRAREHFARALEIDPDYLDAHLGMYKTWDRWHRNGHGPFDESAEQIQNYAVMLEQLAPGSPQAVEANARSAAIEWDVDRATLILQNAVQRYPQNAAILARWGNQTIINGEFESGMAAMKDAIRLDPLSLENMSLLASIQHRSGDCAGAEETMNRALELDEQAGRVRYHLAMCIYETTGDAGKALEIASTEPLGFMYKTALAILHHRLGDPHLAQEQLDRMVADYGNAASYQYGQIYSQWGEIDTALTWLETALEIRDPGLLLAARDRMLDPLREEPRFIKLLQSAGL
jgi:TolB-like protein/Tfp pilus assembly protein PilF